MDCTCLGTIAPDASHPGSLSWLGYEDVAKGARAGRYRGSGQVSSISNVGFNFSTLMKLVVA
jgi:hypothetical protein